MLHTRTLHAGSPDRDPGADSPLSRLRQTLDRLAACREAFALRQATMTVLSALVSFVPRDAPPGMLLVWPSNATLCRRAQGMEERTLRRHLARLCEAGLVRRRTSTNGKRFALRGGQSVLAAFGFDLAPLLERSAEIASIEATCRAQHDEMALLRLRILERLHRLSADGSFTAAEAADSRKLLRRRTDPETLRALLSRMPAIGPDGPADPPERAMAETHIGAATVKMSASHSRNDRHHQRSLPELHLTDARAEAPDRESSPRAAKEPGKPQPVNLSFSDCLSAIGTSRALWSSPIRGWPDLVRVADTLAPMVGIGADVAEHARRSMGTLPAAITILCLIERGEAIRVPGAYLRKLARQAEGGSFSLAPIVRLARAAPRRLPQDAGVW